MFHKLLPGVLHACILIVNWCFWSIYYHRLTSIGLITYTTPCSARTEWRLCFISYYPIYYMHWSLYCCVVFYPLFITELPVLYSVHICNSVQCEERMIIEFHKIIPVYLNVCTFLVNVFDPSTIIWLLVLFSLHIQIRVALRHNPDYVP